MLKNRQNIFSDIINSWYNTYGCADQYIFATALYLLSILLQAFNIIIDRGISVQVHGKEVVDGLNYTHKRFIFHLMATIKLPGSQRIDTKMKFTHKRTILM